MSPCPTQTQNASPSEKRNGHLGARSLKDLWFNMAFVLIFGRNRGEQHPTSPKPGRVRAKFVPIRAKIGRN